MTVQRVLAKSRNASEDRGLTAAYEEHEVLFEFLLDDTHPTRQCL